MSEVVIHHSKENKKFFLLSFLFFSIEKKNSAKKDGVVDVNLNRFEGPHDTLLSICLLYVWQEDKLEN